MRMQCLAVSVLLVAAAAAVAGGSEQKTLSRQLAHDLFHAERYDKRVKPTMRDGSGVNVTFRLDLYQILDVDEPKQSVTINCWAEESWYDDTLYWDPAEYNGIRKLTVPYDTIWLPDTVLYNNLKMSDSETRRLLNIQLTTGVGPHNDSVLAYLLYPTIFTFSCRLDIVHFPFDEQRCQLVFGSWTYETPDIDYFVESPLVGTDNYIHSEGWQLVNFTGERKVRHYQCCPNPYTNLQFEMIVRRKPLYYIINLVVPTCIITMISLVGFFMPSNAKGERNEKISLGITTLLSMSILLLMISDTMPTTSNYVPLIGRFYLAMIGLISSGTVTTAVIIEVHKRGMRGRPMSSGWRCFFYCLSVVTRTRVPHHVRQHMCGNKKPKTSVSTCQSANEQQQPMTPRTPLAPLVSPESDVLTERNHYKLMSGGRPYYLNGNAAKNSDAYGCSADEAKLRMPTKKQVPGWKYNLMWQAQDEFEWAANVLEKIALVSFLCMLFAFTVGILSYGAIASGRMESVLGLLSVVAG